MPCKGQKPDGTRCRSPESLVDPDTGFCPAHDKNAGETMRERARRGGEATRRRWQGTKLEDNDLPPLNSPQAASVWLETLGRAVATGQLANRDGDTAVRAVREWLRAWEVGEQAQKLEELREQVTALKKRREFRVS